MDKTKGTFDEIKEAVANNLWICLGLLLVIATITALVFIGGYEATGSLAIALCFAIIAFIASTFILSVCFKMTSLFFSAKKKSTVANNETTESIPTLIPCEDVSDVAVSSDIEEATIIEEIKMPFDPYDQNHGHTKESLAEKGYGTKNVEINSRTYSIYEFITLKEKRFYILHIFHEQLHNIPVPELAADLAAFYEFGLMKEIPHKMLEAELGEAINKGNYSNATHNIDIEKKIAFKKILKAKGFSDSNEKNGSSR